MDNKEIIKNFKTYMEKMNKDWWRTPVIWMVSFGMMIVSGGEEMSTFLNKTFRFNLIVALLLIAVSVKMYLERYTEFYGGFYKDRADRLDVSNPSFTIPDIMKYHSFNMAEYIGSVYKKIIPLQIVTVGVTMGLMALKIVPFKVAGIYSLGILIIPALTAFLYSAIAGYKMNHNTGLGFNVIMGLIRGVYSWIKVFAVGVAFVLIGLLIVAVCSSSKLMKGIDQSVPVRFSSDSSLYMIIFIIGLVGLSVFVTDVGKDIISVNWNRIKNKITALIAIVVLAAGVLICYISLNENVRLEEDSITVTHKGKAVEYAFSDIDSYRIYDHDSSIQMELTFKDGSTAKLYRDNSDDTDAWTERYHSDYLYTAYLAEKLDELGVKGSLEDAEKLGDSASMLGGDTLDSFNRIMAVAGR